MSEDTDVDLFFSYVVWPFLTSPLVSSVASTTLETLTCKLLVVERELQLPLSPFTLPWVPSSTLPLVTSLFPSSPSPLKIKF